ncbi:unnamed protein product, partial [Ectocarpus sp. 12 AP-2014]
HSSQCNPWSDKRRSAHEPHPVSCAVARAVHRTPASCCHPCQMRASSCNLDGRTSCHERGPCPTACAGNRTPPPPRVSHELPPFCTLDGRTFYDDIDHTLLAVLCR